MKRVIDKKYDSWIFQHAVGWWLLLTLTFGLPSWWENPSSFIGHNCWMRTIPQPDGSKVSRVLSRSNQQQHLLMLMTTSSADVDEERNLETLDWYWILVFFFFFWWWFMMLAYCNMPTAKVPGGFGGRLGKQSLQVILLLSLLMMTMTMIQDDDRQYWFGNGAILRSLPATWSLLSVWRKKSSTDQSPPRLRFFSLIHRFNSNWQPILVSSHFSQLTRFPTSSGHNGQMSIWRRCLFVPTPQSNHEWGVGDIFITPQHHSTNCQGRYLVEQCKPNAPLHHAISSSLRQSLLLNDADVRRVRRKREAKLAYPRSHRQHFETYYDDLTSQHITFYRPVLLIHHIQNNFFPIQRHSCCASSSPNSINVSNQRRPRRRQRFLNLSTTHMRLQT